MVDYIKLYSIIIPVIVSLDIYWDILKLDYIITGIFTGIHYNWEISPLLLDYLHFPSLDRRFNVPSLLETLLIASIPSSHDIPITLLWYSHAIRIIIPMAFPFYSPTKSDFFRQREIASGSLFTMVYLLERHEDRCTTFTAAWPRWPRQRELENSDLCMMVFARVKAYWFVMVYIYIYIPVVPHKAVAEVSKIGNL